MDENASWELNQAPGHGGREPVGDVKGEWEGEHGQGTTAGTRNCT
jgi:hypothetical protein